ncbi:aminopeptidase N [Gephyromycinifex aptenodytis]|uniref:aminopeptidase N n=1 Tax=Gephyromycinifex aptenodytis TaxID=2716227 RepID=UPI001447CBD9|nr:aminopeptidase N [Gephyromycinifex aptenodytis]
MTSNLRRDEARQRSADLRLTSYRVELDLTEAADPQAATFPTQTSLTLTSSSSDTFLDFLDGEVEHVDIDGAPIPVRYDGARVQVSGLPVGRECTVTVKGRARYSRSGEGMHRYVDPADGLTYLYTQYEPADARRVFANIEQPDLKASFTFVVTGPSDWEIRSNSREISREEAPAATSGAACARRIYDPTPPLSTYLTCVIAGPYRRWDQEWTLDLPDREPLRVPLALLCRRSLAPAFDSEALFELTKQGLEHFHRLFDYPYPWGKYDQIFVPEYNLGAMENPGLVTFTDARYIFESAATRAQLEGRSNTLMHEMSHMWFGDLVTPQWWDDLWLKESFADYMGTAANATATEFRDAWTPFCARRKAWAYEQDQLPTTHPIVADIPDVEAARANFDGITYAKGASVLKQLVAYVGEEAFHAGARTYFAKHEFSSTTLPDLLVELEEASGRDLGPWSDAWLRTTGTSTLTPALSLTDGDDPRIAELVIEQDGTDPISGVEVLRDHRLAVGLYELYSDGVLRRSQRIELDVTGSRTVVEDAQGAPAPALVLINDDDLTYAKVRLDATSMQTVREHLGDIEASLSRACVWSALWNACRDAVLPAADYVDIVLRQAPRESHVALLTDATDHALVAARAYAPADQQDDLVRRILDVAIEQMRACEPGSGSQLVWARVVASAAQSCAEHAELLRAVLDGREHIEGLALDGELRWAFWRALAGTGHASVDELDAARRADPGSRTHIRHLSALASVPDAETKAAAWSAVVEEAGASNEEVSAWAAGFNHPGHSHLTQDYRARYLGALIPVWQERSQEIATRFVRGFFPGGAQLAAGQAPAEHPSVVQVQGWLDAHPDAPRALRREIIENLDRLRRALTAQAAGSAS